MGLHDCIADSMSELVALAQRGAAAIGGTSLAAAPRSAPQRSHPRGGDGDGADRSKSRTAVSALQHRSPARRRRSRDADARASAAAATSSAAVPATAAVAAAVNVSPHGQSQVQVQVYAAIVAARDGDGDDACEWFIQRTTTGMRLSSAAQHNALPLEFDRTFVSPLGAVDAVADSDVADHVVRGGKGCVAVLGAKLDGEWPTVHATHRYFC
jgi:hypothetical protein